MTILSLDLTKKMTVTEENLVQKLQVAALTKNTDEVNELLQHPIIKKLFKHGILKTNKTVLSFPGDPDLEL